MNYGFQNLPFVVSTFDGHNVKQVKPIFYKSKDGTLYQLPENADSDGASTMRGIWSVLPPFGKYWPATFGHDCAYRGTLLVYQNEQWIPAMLTKQQSDDLLLEMMESLGVEIVEREVIYRGVVIGGQSAFDQDRKAFLPFVNPTLSLPGTVCETTQQGAPTAVPAPAVAPAPVPGP